MSFTSEIFPIGCNVLRDSFGSFSCIGVSTMPGATAFTRMPCFYVPHREAPRDCLKAALCDHWNRGVCPGDGVVHHCRCDVYDAAAGLLCEHLLDRKLADEKKAIDIDGNKRPQIVGRVFGKMLREKNACV